MLGTSLWFCPKDVLISVGMFEDTPCKQDSIMLLKLLCNGYNIYRVPENLVYYYEHGGNGISGTKKRAPQIIQKLNIEWLYRIIGNKERIKRFYDSNVKFIFKLRKLVKEEK